MMTAFDPTLTFAGLIALGGAWALFLGPRTRSMQLRRDESMRDAISLLALHIGALEALDDPAVPYSLRELALEISDLLHDADRVPHLVEAARLRSKGRPEGVPPEEPPPGAARDNIASLHANARRLHAKRPDLSEAFGRCIVAGILSFKRRHPDCAAVLDLNAARVVASPIVEAERVIRRARDVVVAMASKADAPLVMQP